MLRINYTLLLIISILAMVLSVNSEVFAKDFTVNELARSAIKSYLAGNEVNFNAVKLINIPDINLKGVFVTLLDENKKSRGCWGELYPQSDIKDSIISAAIGTIKKEYRFKPVSLAELSDLKIQVSLVTAIQPVDSFSQVNPFGDGMMVKSSGRTGIIMPGETVDPYYQMIQCKLKAGIQPGESFNLFRLKTKIYKEK